MTVQSRAELLSGAKDIPPLAAGVAIYGLAFGLLAAQAGMSSLQVGVMGTLVFGGSSQIIAVERLTAGAGATAAIVAGFALSLRLILVTASIRDIYAERPAWQVLLGAHLTADENWALMLARRAAGGQIGYWYLIGAGLILLSAWVVSGIMGAAFAAAIPQPQAYGLDFAFTAAFIAIARSLWRGRLDMMPWIISAAVVFSSVLSGSVGSSWAIIIGGLAGAAYAGFRTND